MHWYQESAATSATSHFSGSQYRRAGSYQLLPSSQGPAPARISALSMNISFIIPIFVRVCQNCRNMSFLVVLGKIYCPCLSNQATVPLLASPLAVSGFLGHWYLRSSSWALMPQVHQAEEGCQINYSNIFKDNWCCLSQSYLSSEPLRTQNQSWKRLFTFKSWFFKTDCYLA